MATLGYLRQLNDKRYRIGRPLFALAAGALDEMEMVSLATPILAELSRRTGESGHFSVPLGDTIVVLARTLGSGAFQLADRIGVVRPAYCTALGKIVLAGLPKDQLLRYLDDAELKPLTPRTITERKALLGEVDQVRHSDVAFDDREFDPELRCAAMPIRNFTGQVIGAIGISGPVWRMSLQTLHGYLPNLKQAAIGLSHALGAPAAANS
jgi:IclR family transcriptional regulator, KDG regulon repressor